MHVAEYSIEGDCFIRVQCISIFFNDMQILSCKNLAILQNSSYYAGIMLLCRHHRPGHTYLFIY